MQEFPEQECQCEIAWLKGSFEEGEKIQPQEESV